MFDGYLGCARCEAAWPVVKGLAKLYDEGAFSTKERLMRFTYDRFGHYHDGLVRMIFPFLRSETAADTRDRYMAKLELTGLKNKGRTPIRILEVGIGTGDDVPALRRHLPMNLNVEIWGVDVSLGMLRQLRQKLPTEPYDGVRVLMADAHALPFKDRTFDRVFHVGAANSYRDPKRALREMARVARVGSPIVVVDERLGDNPRLRDLVLYQMLTSYDVDEIDPREFVPKGSKGVRLEQLNPVFYCMTFRP
jgi:SAM-dependent methyltransferase